MSSKRSIYLILSFLLACRSWQQVRPPRNIREADEEVQWAAGGEARCLPMTA